MFIESLELKDFRNFEMLSLTFDRGTNVFYGDNAQGKTNILESIHLCGTSRSHRGSRDSEMIRFGTDEAHIRMFLYKSGMQRKIDMHLRKNRSKGIAIDGMPIRKASELLGLVSMVFFSPEDLNIIKNGPKERRKFLDSLLCQMDPYYLHQLASYNRILLQRNMLLKEMGRNESLSGTLDVWDAQLIRYGSYLIAGRKKIVKTLNEIIQKIHAGLTGGRENIRIIYQPNTEETIFAEKLKEAGGKDIALHNTSVGPHRDDFHIYVNDIDIRRFGSQGQQRSAALSLKLSEIRMIENNTGEKPVLLLDDVLSELDSNRQNDLLRNIKNIQTFITCTGMDDLVEHQFPIDRVFHVSEGRITE